MDARRYVPCPQCGHPIDNRCDARCARCGFKFSCSGEPEPTEGRMIDASNIGLAMLICIVVAVLLAAVWQWVFPGE